MARAGGLLARLKEATLNGIDLSQISQPPRADHQTMAAPDKQTEDKESKPPRLDEARRIIEEYANDLREIIKKLRRRMN